MPVLPDRNITQVEATEVCSVTNKLSEEEKISFILKPSAETCRVWTENSLNVNRLGRSSYLGTTWQTFIEEEKTIVLLSLLYGIQCMGLVMLWQWYTASPVGIGHNGHTEIPLYPLLHQPAQVFNITCFLIYTAPIGQVKRTFKLRRGRTKYISKYKELYGRQANLSLCPWQTVHFKSLRISPNFCIFWISKVFVH